MIGTLQVMVLAGPDELLKYVSVMPHHKAADIGAGSGAFTDALLNRIGVEGRVYALDALPQLLDSIRRRSHALGKKCMTVCAEFEQGIPLTDNLLDIAIVANTLHAVDPFIRDSFVREIARVVRPGGRALIVDWAGSFNNMGPPASLIVTPVEAVRLFRSQGFETSDMLPAGTHQYAFVATLPEVTLVSA